jgi:hypothetical protein
VLLCEWVSERERRNTCTRALLPQEMSSREREACASPTAAQLSNYNKQCVVGIIATSEPASQQPFGCRGRVGAHPEN